MAESNFCESCRVSHPPREHLAEVLSVAKAEEKALALEDQFIKAIIYQKLSIIKQLVRELRAKEPNFNFVNALQRSLVVALIKGNQAVIRRVIFIAGQEKAALNFRTPEVKVAYERFFTQSLVEGRISRALEIKDEMEKHNIELDVSGSCAQALLQLLSSGRADGADVIEKYAKSHNIQIALNSPEVAKAVTAGYKLLLNSGKVELAAILYTYAKKPGIPLAEIATPLSSCVVASRKK